MKDCLDRQHWLHSTPPVVHLTEHTDGSKTKKTSVFTVHLNPSRTRKEIGVIHYIDFWESIYLNEATGFLFRGRAVS